MSQMRTVVVGATFHKGAMEALVKLQKGEELILARQPENPYDKNAVAVLTQDWQCLGYIPRQDAPAVAKVLDMGLATVATVVIPRANHILIEWEVPNGS